MVLKVGGYSISYDQLYTLALKQHETVDAYGPIVWLNRWLGRCGMGDTIQAIPAFPRNDDLLRKGPGPQCVLLVTRHGEDTDVNRRTNRYAEYEERAQDLEVRAWMEGMMGLGLGWMKFVTVVDPYGQAWGVGGGPQVVFEEQTSAQVA